MLWLQAAVRTTDALNMRQLPRRMSSADINDFDVEGPDAQRRWTVSGEAIERFAAMTNWDYYEAMLRFQKVLDATGESLPPEGCIIAVKIWKTLSTIGSQFPVLLHFTARADDSHGAMFFQEHFLHIESMWALVASFLRRIMPPEHGLQPKVGPCDGFIS